MTDQLDHPDVCPTCLVQVTKSRGDVALDRDDQAGYVILNNDRQVRLASTKKPKAARYRMHECRWRP